MPARLLQRRLARLLRVGCQMTIYNRTRSKAEGLQSLGASIVDSPAALASCDIVFTSVSTSEDLLHVLDGPQGLLTGQRAPQLLIDCSSVSEEASARARAELAKRGAQMLAAPVSGNAKVVEAGKLTLVVSGPVIYGDDVSIAEGNDGITSVPMTLHLSTASTQVVRVNWKTGDGTALSGEDYESASGVVEFAAGETSKQVTLRIAGIIPRGTVGIDSSVAFVDVAVTVSVFGSITAIELVSSRFTKTLPAPSEAANSGFAPRGMVPATAEVDASMAVAFLPRPLKVKTRFEKVS